LGRREEKKKEKRERLEREGLRLFMENGYDRTSIEQIAAASDVARGTFYLYFKDKLTIFETLVDRWQGVTLELMEYVVGKVAEAKTPEECMAVYMEMGMNLALIALSNKDEFLLTFREMRSSGDAGDSLRAFELKLQEVVIGFTQDAMERKLIQVENPTLTVLVVFGAVERLYFEFLVGRDLGDADAIANDAVQMLGKGMGLPVPANLT
jgi:AcrR family transcriptional regulator